MALDFQSVDKPVRKLRKLLKKMGSEPSPEQVHDFRTSSRQLEVTLQAFGLDTRSKGRKVLKPLERLRKKAGKVRDMDVLTQYTASLPRNDAEKECSVQLLEHLGAERRKFARKFQSLSQRDGSSLRKRLNRTQKKFARLESKTKSLTTLSAQVPAAALEMGSELATPARLSRTNLHPFRLKVKDLRNVLKLAQSPDQDFVDRLGEVKDAIGEWHDWEELVSIAKEVLDHGTQCRLLRELKDTARKRYATALTEAEQLRKKYLGVAARQKTKRSQASTPAKPVWSAAMKLAA